MGASKEEQRFAFLGKKKNKTHKWGMSGRGIGKAYLSKPEKSEASIPGHSPLLQIHVPRRQMLGKR